MVGNSFLSGLSDAQMMEREPTIVPAIPVEEKLSPIASAFMGTNAGAENSTSDFAQAMGNYQADTSEASTESHTNFTEAFSSLPDKEVATETPAFDFAPQEVFGLPEKMRLQDELVIAQLKAELEQLVSEAKALNSNSSEVQEVTKILMAQETGTEGVYYLNFLDHLRLGVERFIKSMQQLTVNASQGGSWTATKDLHDRQRDELKLHAQAAG